MNPERYFTILDLIQSDYASGANRYHQFEGLQRLSEETDTGPYSLSMTFQEYLLDEKTKVSAHYSWPNSDEVKLKQKAQKK